MDHAILIFPLFTLVEHPLREWTIVFSSVQLTKGKYLSILNNTERMLNMNSDLRR